MPETLQWTKPTVTEMSQVDFTRAWKSMQRADQGRTPKAVASRIEAYHDNVVVRRTAATAYWNSLTLQQQMLKNAQQRYHNHPPCVKLTLADIPMIPENCPVCGVRFTERGGPRNTVASLDRIDSRRGYEPGNVAIICFSCNTRKRDSTIEQLEAIIAYMRKNGQ